MLNNTPTCIIWETDFITHKLNICPDGDQGPDDIQAGFKEAPSQQEDEEAIAVVKGSVQQTAYSLPGSPSFRPGRLTNISRDAVGEDTH